MCDCNRCDRYVDVIFVHSNKSVTNNIIVRLTEPVVIALLPGARGNYLIPFSCYIPDECN